MIGRGIARNEGVGPICQRARCQAKQCWQDAVGSRKGAKFGRIAVPLMVLTRLPGTARFSALRLCRVCVLLQPAAHGVQKRRAFRKTT